MVPQSIANGTCVPQFITSTPFTAKFVSSAQDAHSGVTVGLTVVGVSVGAEVNGGGVSVGAEVAGGCVGDEGAG